MPCVIIKSPGIYLVEILRREVPLPFISIRIETYDGSSETLFVPALTRTSYLLETTASYVRIHFDAGEVKLAGLKRINRLRRQILLRRKSDRRHCMKFTGDVKVTPLLRAEGRPGRELSKALRLISNWGFGLTTNHLQTTPGLLAPRATHQVIPEKATTEDTKQPRFAIVLHLYYQELWPEFEVDLLQLRQNFHLIVTTTQNNASFEASVRNSFANAEIHVFENRGRDVGPFLQLLHDGQLDDYPYICKLHGKRSGISGPRALFGEVWRRTNVADLIGTSAQVNKILGRFAAAPHIGMIGSPRFRLPNEFIQHHSAWAKNRDLTLSLAERMGIHREDFRLDFFAGTMFWIRREALTPLRALNLTLIDFPNESGAIDGELQHAVERAFGAAIQGSGMFLESVPALSTSQEVRDYLKNS